MADRAGEMMPADVLAALRAVVASRARLEQAGLPWGREHDAAAAAAVLATVGATGGGAGGGSGRLVTVGLVGGASSGKSTLLNNLVGRTVSDVAIRAHTTQGPIVAASAGQIEAIRGMIREHGWLLRSAELREEAATPVAGTEGLITVVTVDPAARAVQQPGSPELLLVDTPDFTSLAARDSGDLTRGMLPWMDRVVVTIDEDRWFDEQVFGWLRRRLDDLGIERLVVFNRCQRGGETGTLGGPAAEGSPDVGVDAARLTERARLFDAEHVVMPFAPGRGPAVLSPERLRAVQRWLGRPIEAGQSKRRCDRLVSFVAQAARRTVDENARRAALHAELGERLKHEAAALAPDDRVLAFEVLLSARQRRQLDPIYQAVVRPVEWAGQWSRRITGGLAAMRDVEGRDEHETIVARGRAFFLSERARAVDRLGTVARRSELCPLAGGATIFEQGRSPAGEAGIEEQAVALSRDCERAFDAFIERLEAEAKGVRLGPVSSGGALAGAVIGGVLAAAPGGVLMPVGAAIGAAVGGVTSAAGARSAWRVVRLMMRTPELRELWNAVRAYRQGLVASAQRERERLLAAAAAAFIQQGEPLEHALKRLAASKGGSHDSR